MHKLAAWAWLISQWSSKLSLTSPRKEGILLERERFGQQKTNNSELGWVGHWSVWCSWVCFPTSSDSFQLQIRMCPVPPNCLGLWICKAGTSKSLQVCYYQGKNAAREAVTHSLSRGSNFSSSAFLPLCALCRKKRDASWLVMGWDCLPDKKTSKCLNVHSANQFMEEFNSWGNGSQFPMQQQNEI